MTIQHKDIPDTERHEPKGITTAAVGTAYVANGDTLSGSWTNPSIAGQAGSLSGQILKADGAGGTSFKHSPEGWGYYKHAGVAQQFTTAFTKLVIDGAGGTSESGYLPYEVRGTGELWDTVNNKMLPIAIGDSYAVRLDLPISAKGGSPTEVTIELDIGGNSLPTIVINEAYVLTAKTPPYQVTFNFNLFSLTTFLTNGGQFFIKTDVGTVDVSTAAIFITRTTSGDF